MGVVLLKPTRVTASNIMKASSSSSLLTPLLLTSICLALLFSLKEARNANLNIGESAREAHREKQVALDTKEACINELEVKSKEVLMKAEDLARLGESAQSATEERNKVQEKIDMVKADVERATVQKETLIGEKEILKKQLDTLKVEQEDKSKQLA